MNRLRAIWRLLNMPCEGMSRLSSESLDRELGRLERFALRSHLLYCTACRRYRRQLELLRCAMRRLASDAESGDNSPGPGLPVDVRERIKQALKSR
jgi:predicted anti-sigma-YlaC factor YlaD